MDKKTIIISFVVSCLVILLTGGTYAYLSWSSSSEQNTIVTFTKEAGYSCSANGGGNITEGDVVIAPTDCTTGKHVIKREITVNPSITDINMPIYMDLWLNINSMGTGLSNSNNFKYSLTTSSTNCETDVVSSGTFTGKTAGDKVTILNGNTYTSTTTETYYLYIWLDKEETSSDTMDQSFSLSLGGQCTNEISTEPNVPVLDTGMIPIVFDTSDSTKVKTISASDSNWYNYDEQKWANAVLVTESSRSNYLNTTGVTVSELDILGYFVWIPRYKYKIWTTGVSSKGNEQEIDIVFEGKNIPKSIATQVGEYYTHPAFTFGDTELDGFWIGKFETTGTSDQPTVKPDIISLRSKNISTRFATALKFAGGTQSDSTITFTGNSTYGLTSKTDSHMLKKREWGAVAYLSHSRYGANREIYINNSSKYYTGRSGGNVPGSTPINGTYTNQTSTTQYNSYGFYTWDGYLLNYNTNTKSTTRDLNKVASTTGNIYGVYDMSGGAYDYVMGNYNNTIGGSGFTTLPDIKYYDLYTIASIRSCTIATCGGHAINETAFWYSDTLNFVSSNSPWLWCGGEAMNGVNTGIFDNNGEDRVTVGNDSFRVSLLHVGV